MIYAGFKNNRDAAREEGKRKMIEGFIRKTINYCANLCNFSWDFGM
jgi:hypothetical protein